MHLNTFTKYRANILQVGARHLNSQCFTSRPTRPIIHLIAHASPQDKIQNPSQSLETAWNLLQEFTRKEARSLAQPMLSSCEKRRALRNALLLAAAHPWPPAGYSLESEILLGVLASDIRLGVRSLRDYCAALGLEFILPTSRINNSPTLPSIQTSVYIKYNSKSGLCYVTAYEGKDRGVLVQLGGDQFGHLPLGIWDELQEKEFSLSS
ncbi:hypothetical protein Ndes2437B_g08479 [Nannochloris sp. 'desiccata']